MMHATEQTQLQRAARDLAERTLQFIPGHLAKLLYLACTRDYNSGRYYHDGLAYQFSSAAAEAALASAHQEAFEQFVFSPLKIVVEELDQFIHSAHNDPRTVLETWK